jgi:hypothetical protein
MTHFRSSTAFAALFCLAFGLAGCSSLGLQTDASYGDKDKEQLYKNGSVVSDGGGFNLLGGDSKKSEKNNGVAVNGYLWRATLDTVSFMPIASADPFGGIITTGWYSAANAPNERIKLNVYILDRDLRADGVKVAVFRQTKGVSGQWQDAAVTPATGSSLEDAILTRARQIKLAQREAK